MRTSVFQVAALAALLAAAPAFATGDAAAGLQAMRETNLIVLGNLNGGHDVEGKSFIGGNVTGNSFTVGIGNASQGAAASSRPTITIGGNNSASNININNGPNGSSGTVATSPGAVVGGNSNAFNLNMANANVAIGGNLTGLSVSSGSNVNVGGSLGQVNLGQNSTVKVGGNASNINGASGASLQVGGSLSGYANGNGATIQHNLGIGFNGPTVADVSGQTAALTADLRALSAALGGLTIVSNPSSVTFSGSRATFNAVDSGAGYALFNVNASIFSAGEFDYNFASSTLPVIINVSGASSYTWLANAVGGNNSSANSQVIWNFEDATSVDFQRLVHGSVLAPFATISNNTPIEGSVAVLAFNQGGEIHLGTYGRTQPFLPLATGSVPEPSIWALLIAGFGFTGMAMRRRAAAAVA